ncbi:RND transporter [Winogradskyella sp. PC-19]|uniref:efflux RND transporter permease subunit n=1 Tax=unclassified Winogradskyella TaxID=2615021 RepID=UPI000B3C6003|nr:MULTISPECIES: MMPL family transporter [unclassified Winogradskyella]ARV09775.1 RND transporter [Winogradskyella sp. PC-19]RZN76044.1 MAG: RND transporter [Winogradskyella sp.]
MERLRKIIAAIIKFRVAIIAVLAIAMGFSGYNTLNKLSVDNSLGIWFLEDDPSYKAYIDFQESFGSDEIFIAMLPVENAIGEAEVSALKELHQKIEALPYVQTSFSLAKAKYPIYANKTINFDDLYNPKRSEKGLKNLFKKLPNITSQLVTKDYKNQFFYIQLNPTPTVEEDRQAIAAEMRAIIESNYENYYLTGPPVLNEAYSKGIYKESLIFGVLTVLVITIMLLFLLPSKRYLIISLLSVAIPISLLFGLITSLGFALNMISMLIPTILMVYSVSDAVHIINIYHKEGLANKSLTKVELLSVAIRKSLTPCFYTTLTTFVGYFALYLSPLPAFKNMGIFTCIGLLLSFILVYIITIIGFSYMNLNFEKAKPLLSLKRWNQTAFIDWLNRVTSDYKNGIIIGFTVVLLIGVYSIFQVKIDTNSRDLLAEGKAKQDLRSVEAELGGSNRLQINISTADGSVILKKDALKSLEDFQEKLEVNTLISNPVSVVNIKQFLEKRTPVLFQSNVSEDRIKTTLSEVDAKDNSFFKLFSEDLTTAGFTLTLMEGRTSQLNQVLEDIKVAFEGSFDTNGYKLKINGFAVVFAQLNNFILETQFKSFFAAFFVAFLCLLIFIKNFRTTILVLIPNLLPLTILAILMSVLDIPLDVTTAMITPIMLGIAMDDTIHLVYKYRRSKTISGTPKQRMDNAINYTGGALFSTTIALVGGFLIIASSATPSVRDFGLLCATTVAIALITDIFYLPALLKKFDK